IDDIRVLDRLVGSVLRGLNGVDLRRHQNVPNIIAAVRILDHLETVTGCQRTTIAEAYIVSITCIYLLLTYFERPLAVVEYFLQFGGLLAAAGIYAVEALSEVTGIVIDFKILIAADIEPA